MASHKRMYVHELPYHVRKKLCEVLDMDDDSWQKLGAQMNYDRTTLCTIGRNPTPSSILLHKWSTEHHSVDELFRLLHKIGHMWAMSIIVNLVRPELRGLLRTESDSISSIVGKDVNINTIESKPRLENKVETLVTENCVLDGPTHISYNELMRVTNGWNDNNLLGKGGFGMVYRAVWLETQVAIKRIKKQGSVHNQSLFTELRSLSSMVHENILPLYGYSSDGEFGCLVYQFMVGGTVEDRLQLRGPAAAVGPLSWPERHSIAVGVARGLNFLHCAREKPLVHGDIKSANILLDSRLVPKIGDFGLTRLGPSRDVTSVRVSQVHGTKPYLPDELLRSGKLSPKVDTYSFGVVLMELTTGLRAWNPRSHPQLLRDVVLTTIASDEIDTKLADSKAPGNALPTARHLLSIARVCCDENPKRRPEMKDVLLRLEEDCRQSRQCATCSTRLVGGQSQSPDARSLSPHTPQRTPSPALLQFRTPSPNHPLSPVQQLMVPGNLTVNQAHPNHLSPPLLCVQPPHHCQPAFPIKPPYQGQVFSIQPPFQGQPSLQLHQPHHILSHHAHVRPSDDVSIHSVNEPPPCIQEVESIRTDESDLSPSPTSTPEPVIVPEEPPLEMPTCPDPFSLPLVSIIHGGQPEVQSTEAS